MRNPLVPNSNLRLTPDTLATVVEWCGQSGRAYKLFRERLENFVLTGKNLYVIVQGNETLWIGTAGDIIDDHASRASFRAALKVASSVLRLGEKTNDVQRMKIKWDLEGGYLADTRELAPAI